MVPLFAVSSLFFDKEKVKKVAKNGTAKSLQHMGFIVRKSSKDSMDRSVNGEPSKAGDPPNIQRGRLTRSVRTEQVAWNHVVVFANIGYAAIHELGEYYGKKVDKRPFLLPALQREYQRLPAFTSLEMKTEANW